MNVSAVMPMDNELHGPEGVREVIRTLKQPRACSAERDVVWHCIHLNPWDGCILGMQSRSTLIEKTD